MSKMKILIAEDLSKVPQLAAWWADYIAAEKRRDALTEELGAEGAFGFPFQSPSGFKFSRAEPPEGWTKPKADGFSRPKRNNAADIARIEALNYPVPLATAVPDIYGLPVSLNYETATGSGGKALGGLFGFKLGWIELDEAPLLLAVPNYEVEAAEVLDRHPEARLTWTTARDGTAEAAEPFIPEGL